jgi:hypothetical protein
VVHAWRRDDAGVLTTAAAALALTAHAPVVVHDSRERSPLTSVASAPANVPGLDRDRRPAVYGRAAPAEGGGTWLQYWMFFRHNDQDRGIVRSGRHAGDWEMVQLRLDARGRPEQAVYAQHSGAERCGWGTVERRGAGHPVIYLANGSHAAYLRPGTRDRTFPDPNDEADGRGRVVRPRLVEVSATAPRWMRWPGHWGGARARWWNPYEQDSPVGPAFQGQGRWSDPDAWARDARDCRSTCDELGECDWRENALGGGLLAALGLAGAGWLRRRRRQSGV